MNGPIITVGGNIGCGKSTIIDHLGKNKRFEVFPEPIQEWGSWIDLFYENKEKYAFGFQMKILSSFFKMRNDVTKISITERSPIDSLVFAKILVDTMVMSKIEYDLIEEYVKLVGWVPNYYIYLQTDPDICIDRIKQRARDCETNIDEKYVKQLHKYYETFYMRLYDENCKPKETHHRVVLDKAVTTLGLHNKPNAKTNVFVVDANQNKKDVLKDVGLIMKTIYKMQIGRQQ